MRPTLILAAACALAVAVASCGGSNDGAPRVAQFTVPDRFWCLEGQPAQAQVTVGWNVPAATRVDVRIDGKYVHAGIRKTLPFSVEAGEASGIGTTVVFPCRSGSTHELAVRWRAKGSPWTERTATITKAGAG